MTAPITWLALELVAERVRGITTAAGYYTNLGLGTVLLEELQHDDLQPHVLISMTDAPVDEQGSGRRSTVSTAYITVEYIIPAGADNARRIAHAARADLVRALRQSTRGATPGIGTITMTGATLAPRERTTDSTVAQVTLTVRTTESTDPYA